jgi:hypothetical protein
VFISGVDDVIGPEHIGKGIDPGGAKAEVEVAAPALSVLKAAG